MKTERVLHLLELEKQYRLKQRGFQQKPINKEVAEALDIAKNAVGAIEQVRWERDIAIEQLAEYGVCFGEKKKDIKAVRYGKWQHRKAKETDVAKWFLCSECNGRAYSDGYTFELSEYCPHCGAKMIEIERNTDNG